MELKNNKVYFSSASNWKAVNTFLKNKGMRPTKKPWEIEKGALVQEIENIPNILPEFMD